MNIPRYTTMLHGVRKKLGLSCNEFCVADMIYHLSKNYNNGEGWCYMSKENMAIFLDLSKQTIHKVINTLLEKGLIIKHPQTKYVKTTTRWYDLVVTEKTKITDSKKNLPGVKSLVLIQSNNFTSDSKKNVHNNNKDKDKDKDNDHPWNRSKHEIRSVADIIKNNE